MTNETSTAIDEQALTVRLLRRGLINKDGTLPETTEDTPEVGNAATLGFWTDRAACTIVEVRRGGAELVLRRDRAILLNGANSAAPDKLEFFPGGFCGHTRGEQRYRYEADPEGTLYYVTRRWVTSREPGQLPCKVRRYKEKGSPTRAQGGWVRLGVRAEHYDYNF